MITVSFQGLELSASQKRQLEFQRQARSSFMNSVLADQVAETLRAVEVRKEQGVKPERVWFVDRQEKGTISVAEWMGY